MSKVSAKSTINASANEVWKTIRSFDRVERFLPIVTSSTMEGSGEGAKRTCTIQGGEGQGSFQLVEKLERIDDGARTLRYSVTNAPPPFGGLVNTITVHDLDGNRCEVEFSGTLEARGNSEAEMAKTIEDVFKMALDGLKKLHGG